VQVDVKHVKLSSGRLWQFTAIDEAAPSSAWTGTTARRLPGTDVGAGPTESTTARGDDRPDRITMRIGVLPGARQRPPPLPRHAPLSFRTMTARGPRPSARSC
jgi:hypothetical protein